MAKSKPSQKTGSTRSRLPQSKKPALQHIDWDAIDIEELNPLFRRQYVVGKNVMLARILLRKGSLVPRHSHHNEQISYVLEGTLKFWIAQKAILVRAGEVLLIPPHMPHKIEALEDSLSLDIFDPPRKDWINKTDDYLRHKR